MNKKTKLILASSSLRRKELLNQIGLKFTVVPSRYEEDMTKKMNPEKMARTFARGKAFEVASRLKDGLVIGVDTFIIFRNKKIGKPKSKEEAEAFLKRLSGKKVRVISGICIINAKTKKELVEHEINNVKIKKLSDKEIIEYIQTGEPLDKAGAFAIQGIGAIFIEKVEGSYTGIIGLPLPRLYSMLLKMGFDILSRTKSRNN